MMSHTSAYIRIKLHSLNSSLIFGITNFIALFKRIFETFDLIKTKMAARKEG